MKHLYYNKRTRFAQGAAALIAGGILLGGALWPRAEAVEDEPAQVGFLVIAGQVPQTEEPRHPVLTLRGVDPALCAGVEAPDEEGPSQALRASSHHRRSQEAAPEEVRTYLGTYKITGYDICPSCCGNTKGITASGTTATVGRTCAAPKDIPFGTRLWIEGIGERVVEDRGGAVHGKKLDILCTDHPACYAITGTYEVYIIEEAE